MAVTLLATQVPTPQQYSGFLRLIDGYTAGGNAINAENVAAGDTTDALKKLNRNATQQDLASRYGGGLYAVAYGLTLSIGTGLQVNVAAGHAVMDGIVEVPANTSVNIDPSISRAHIWLLRTGAFEVVNNSLTPPATPAVYIGSCVSGASTITSVDASGIPTLVGGIVIRQTADPAAPGDTPSSSTAFFTRTSGGLYLWDGSAYYGISAGSVPTLFDWKNSVRVVSTSNITLSGTQTIDGVALSVGDRVLVAGQTTGANNGIYTVASGAWSRATDADASAEVTAGMIVPVTEGTTYADTLWCLTTNDTITLGSTTLTFVLISANFTALAGNGLSASGAGLAVNVDGSTIEINADTLRIKDGGVTLAKHANMATDRLLGRDTAGGGAPEELTVGGGLEFSGSGGIQRSALTGDVTASAGSNATTIANDAVTYAKIQNVSATDKLLGRVSSGAGDVEEVTFTDYAQSLLDDADAATARTTLGVGTGDSPQFTGVNIGHASDTTITRVSAGDIAVEGNLVYRAGGTDVPITDGGTGSSTALGALANLGIGFAKLTGDQTCTATTTVANITGLSFSVVNGSYYHFRFVLVVQSDTLTTGIRVTLTTPTFTIFSATVHQVVGADGASSLGNLYSGSITSSGDEVATSAVPATGTDYILIVEGIIVPSANGTVQLQGACEVASGNVKFRQGSMVKYTLYG